MFRNTATATEPAPVEVEPVDLIPLSVLELDLSAPTTGWEPFLAVRGIGIVSDDVGRDAVSRDDARTLLAEKREGERRAREAAAAAERQAVEADRVRRASIWGGIPAIDLPPDVSAASAMFAADKAAQPKRVSVLQHALSNSEGLVFHPIRTTPDEES